MEATLKQDERYSRMLALRDFGEDEMKVVRKAKVSVVGAGGLGSPALRLLTAMGFGKIRIIDRDVVELSNIQRQTVYNTRDIDKPKAEVAAANLALMNPDVVFDPICVSLDNSNAEELLKGSDVILDGLDSFHTRYAVNKASLALGIPYVFAGAIEYHSNLTTFVPGETGCLRCLLADAEDRPCYTCADVGVSVELLSVAAAIEVREALLLTVGRRPHLKNSLMTVDMNTLTFDFFDIEKDNNCPVCSIPLIKHPKESEGPSVTTLCSGAYCIAPDKVTTLDIADTAKRLKQVYEVTKTDQSLSVKTPDGSKITLMATGMAIVKGVVGREDALLLYHKILDD